jgi:hypothetical protein
MLDRRTLVVAMVALAALACTRSSSSPALKELTVDQVAARIALNDGQTVLYDCNGKDRFDKGHVPGARWVQYDAVTAADLPAEKGTMLVFYCASEL